MDCWKTIAVTVALVVLLANSIVVGAPKNPITVGCVCMNMGADSNVLAYEGLSAYAQKQGWRLLHSDCQGEIAKVSPNIINYVNQRVDAIVVVTSEKTIIDRGVAEAEKKGIPVFLIDTENTRNTLVNATSNCWAMGAYLASQVVDRIRATKGDKGPHYVAIIGMDDLYVHRQRQQMMEAVFNSPENPDFEVLVSDSVRVDNWQTASYDLAKAWITQYGKKLSAILGTWDGISWGICRAIVDSGYTKDDIFTMSIDGSAQTYDLIRRGQPFVGVIAQDFRGWATAVGETIQAVVVEGKDPKAVIPASRTIYVPYKWVDESNVPAKGEEDKLFAE